MTPLRLIKLLVLILIPVLGVLYAYQFTGQERELVVPFKPFRAPLSEIQQPGGSKPQNFVWKSPVTVVNFWATWCPPCVEEFPAMMELQRQLEAQGVELIFVSIDDKWEDVEKFLRTYNIPVKEGRLFWDPGRKNAGLWGSDKFPETYVVRSDGWVVEKIIGGQQWTRPAVLRYFQDLGEKFKNFPGAAR